MSNVFSRIVDGLDAKHEAARLIEEILGVDDLFGLEFDDYDSSFEIFVDRADDIQSVTPEQSAAILGLGCARYWINFPDGTEIYCTSERRPAAYNRWDAYNNGVMRRRFELDRLRAECEELRKEVERFQAYAKHERDLGAEAILMSEEYSELRHDAERYRAVKDRLFIPGVAVADFDEWIDAAMRPSGEPK